LLQWHRRVGRNGSMSAKCQQTSGSRATGRCRAGRRTSTSAV
jgi:hypothetical protein